MKKLLLTLALLVSAFALSAQNFPFQVTDGNGGVIENNSTYYIFGDGGDMGELALEFYAKNTSANTFSIIAEKIEIQNVEGTQNSFCFGANCYPSFVFEANYDISPDESILWSFHYQPFDDEWNPIFGEQIMQYSLYDRANPNEKFTVNVTFKYSENGINEYTSADVFSNAYPVPARDIVNFDYNFNTSANAEVAIFNMMGQEVLRNEINGVSGTASINVSDLADGVYFYSLIVNGKTEKSSKLIIRK